MATEGQLASSRTPGQHMRVLRAAVDGLLRHAGGTPVSASSVLQNRRERVEELALEVQELRARREIGKLREEDSESERRRTEERRAEAVANERALAESRLQAARDAERREREQR
ncbi:MAG TPA: hypothetical protein VLX32_13960, partial [Candidatus Acidoferrum sp.]|nr:hypothetical protein [Candidatus Acidoferrum sp.]